MGLPLMSSAGIRRKPDAEYHPIEIKTRSELNRAEELVMRYGDVFFLEDFQTEHDPVVLYTDILQMDENEFKATQYWVKTGKELPVAPPVTKMNETIPFLTKAAHSEPLEA